MNAEIKNQADDLIAKLKEDGVQLDGIQENDVLNALSFAYLEGMNAHVCHNLKAISGVSHE